MNGKKTRDQPGNMGYTSRHQSIIEDREALACEGRGFFLPNYASQNGRKKASTTSTTSTMQIYNELSTFFLFYTFLQISTKFRFPGFRLQTFYNADGFLSVFRNLRMCKALFYKCIAFCRSCRSCRSGNVPAPHAAFFLSPSVRVLNYFTIFAYKSNR